MVSLATEIAFVAVFLWTLSGTIEKQITTAIGDAKSSLFLIGFGVLPLFVLYLYLSGSISIFPLLLAVLSGIFFMLGYVFYLKSVETEQISNTYSVGLIQALLVLIFSLAVLGEQLNAAEIVAGALIFAGVILLGMKKSRFKFNRKMLPSFLGNIFWAVYWMLLAYSITASGQVGLPILLSRVIALASMVFVFLLFFRNKSFKRTAKRKFSYWYIAALGVLAGVIDGSGNGLYAIVVSLHNLAIASILFALSPILVVLFAYVFYHERFDRIHYAGLLLAVIGALILALA